MEKKLTKKEFDKIIDALQNVEADCEMDGLEFDDYMALQIARDTIQYNTGLKEYIKENVGDVKCDEWLANQF